MEEVADADIDKCEQPQDDHQVIGVGPHIKEALGDNIGHEQGGKEQPPAVFVKRSGRKVKSGHGRHGQKFWRFKFACVGESKHGEGVEMGGHLPRPAIAPIGFAQT